MCSGVWLKSAEECGRELHFAAACLARLGRLERLSAQHPPFMPCARCPVYTFRYRWRCELRSGGPAPEWGGNARRLARDLYWYRQCSPTCKANEALASLRDMRAAADHAIWTLEMAKRVLQVRYASLHLALSRVDSAEGSVEVVDWDSPMR